MSLPSYQYLTAPTFETVDFAGVTVLKKNDFGLLVRVNREQGEEIRRLRAEIQDSRQRRGVVPDEYERLKDAYALLLKANHKLGFDLFDVKADLAAANRDLATARDHRDRLIESNRQYRERLDQFNAVLTEAATALEGKSRS